MAKEKLSKKTEWLNSAFPGECVEDIAVVAAALPERVLRPASADAVCTYRLPDGQKIVFPYRVYGVPQNETMPGALTPQQAAMYHAVLSRSDNGFVRERHVRALLASRCPAWTAPYVMKLSDEYVVQILQVIYDALRQEDCTIYRSIAACNEQTFLRSYDRMVSYYGLNRWYCASRADFEQWVGNRLFVECFGYIRTRKGKARR